MANLKKQRRQQRAAAARAANNNNNNNNMHESAKSVPVPIQSHQKKQTGAAAAPRSVPSSPTQRPADAELAEQQQLDQAAAVAAEHEAQQTQTEQQQQQQQAEAEVPAPLSAEDEKHQSTLRDVCARLSAIEFELPVLRSQLSYHAARLAALRMGKFRSPTLNEDKIRLSHNSLRYNMGMVDERTMHAIFRLDSIQTDHADIRKQRKATVARGHALIAESLKMRERMDRLARFLPKAKAEQSPEPAAKESEVPSTPAAEEAAMMQDEEEDEGEEEEEESDAEMEEKYAEPAQPAPKPAEEQKQQQHSQQQQKHAPIQAKNTPAATATPAAAPAPHPFQRKYAPLALPSWEGPTFRSRVHPLTGSLLIETDLTGMLPEDVQVTNDAATRTLTIRGVKLPQPRCSLPQRHAFGGFFGLAPARQLPVEPYGYWTKTINFNEIDTTGTLNLAGLTATLGAGNCLEISIPRVPATRKAAPVQQARRPVHYASGAAYSDDDDADMESHPYARYYQQQPQRPVRRVVQPAYHASPFYSNGWW